MMLDRKKLFERSAVDTYLFVFIGAILLFALYRTSLYSYPLFHTLAEMFSIVIAFGIFVIAWNARNILDNNYLLLIGIANIFVGGIDLMHALTYKGMSVFPGLGANYPTQLWIAARFMESVTLLLAPLFISRNINAKAAITTYAAVFLFLLWSIFSSGIFPACYQEGTGLTPFKKNSEYIICLILIAAGAFLYRKKDAFDAKVLTLLLLSIGTTVVAELAFTFYVGVYDLSNLVGHGFKIVSRYCIYAAIIKTGLQDPFEVIFRNLKQSRAELQQAKNELGQRVKERTHDLAASNEKLMMEIGERKKIEQELRDSESTLRSFYESSPVMMGIVELTDNDEIIHLYDNPRTAEFFGVTDTKDRQASEIGAPESAVKQWVAHYRLSQRLGRPVQFEYQHPRPDGTLWLSSTVSPVAPAPGGRMRFSYVAENITEHKRMEQQLRQSQKIEAIGQLAGGVAHDFNNILSAIMGYGYILQEKMRRDDPLRVNVEHILESVERAAHLTHSLLAFSRKQLINPVNIDLNEVVGRLQKFLFRIIGEDIELKTIFRRQSAIACADSGQIEQVLMNLATNARDAMPKGGCVTIETDTAELDETYVNSHGYWKQGTYAVISVTDNGSGMDDATQRKVFDPFFTTKEPGKGTGLGLAIVYGIVKQHNGYVNLYSEQGKGTTVKIYLPLVDAEKEYKQEQPEDVEPRKGNEVILLAEDDSAVRKLTHKVLKEFGYEIIEASDGEDAVAKFARHRGRIRLAILDIVMPRKSGTEAYEEIRAMDPSIKTIFMSGYPADKVSKEGLLKEGALLLLKPISPRILLMKVGEILDSEPIVPPSVS